LRQGRLPPAARRRREALGRAPCAAGAFVGTGVRSDQQGLAHAQRAALADAVGEREVAAREHDDRRALLEPAELLALLVAGVAGDARRPRVAEAERGAEAVQAQGRDADRGDRDQRERATALELEREHRTL